MSAAQSSLISLVLSGRFGLVLLGEDLGSLSAVMATVCARSVGGLGAKFRRGLGLLLPAADAWPSGPVQLSSIAVNLVSGADQSYHRDGRTPGRSAPPLRPL